MHPKAAEMKVPPLRTGRRLIGPEALGCCNTGTRPTLLRRAEGFYVGAENDVVELIHLRTFDELAGRKVRVSYKSGDRKARFFKTRRPAVAMFRQLISDRLEMNDRLHAEYEQARQESASSNPETAIAGALKLGDFQ